MDLYLFGEINSEMSANVLKSFAYMGPWVNNVTVYLNSEGGLIQDALAIFDVLKQHNTTIVTTGVCGSAATTVLQAGKVRLATPSTQFFFHKVSADKKDLPETKCFIAKMQEVVQKLKQQVMGELNLKTAMALQMFGTDIALKLNVIDGITYNGKTRATN